MIAFGVRAAVWIWRRPIPRITNVGFEGRSSGITVVVTLSICRDPCRMLREVIQARLKGWKGVYDC
jgi:hypothetical protein